MVAISSGERSAGSTFGSYFVMISSHCIDSFYLSYPLADQKHMLEIVNNFFSIRFVHSEGISKMECLKCHFQNPETSKFCLECGEKFKTVCLFCGHLVPPGAKFCNECGEHQFPTGEPISKKEFSQEKLEKIQRYLPKGLTQKILAGKDKIEGERKKAIRSAHAIHLEMARFSARISQGERLKKSRPIG